MCGIFAVSGHEKNAGNIVLKGLKTLEYRGYDSWGICVRNEKDTSIITKDVGKISKVKANFAEGQEAIGHTRWATHGGVTAANAHPHQVGTITLVHNGIFENFESVKTQYLEHTFQSQTDTEVIAVLLNDLYGQTHDPLTAIQKAAEIIEGRFAILVIFEGVRGIFAARRGSPLIVGRGQTESFIASDIPAFLEHTNHVNYLDDHELVHISGAEAQFYNLETLSPVSKRDIEIQWTVEEAQKGDFAHFMIKEIFEQKETILRAINHEDTSIEKALQLLKSTNGAYFISCGTAHKVAMAAEYFFAELSGRKINVVPASEMPAFERFVHGRTAVIAISQSGETADVLEILEQSHKQAAKILAITNVSSSSIARMADVHLPINAGPEKAVASTKAATAQMALCLLLAYADAGHINEGRETLRTAATNINDMINPRYEEHIQKIAKQIYQTRNLFIIGRKSLYPMALESAIKIQEVSYINAQGFAAGELKHGPIALIENGTPCIVLGSDQETISNAMELKARGAHIIGIAPEKAPVFDQWIRVPDCGRAQAIATIVPVQILAYHLALCKGLNPDMPRNLAKSVTVK